jgi:ribosome biogenesis GTPase
LDRYLVMAESAGIPSLICITKLDQLRTLKPDQQAELQDRLDLYRTLGYAVVETSCVNQAGINTLVELLTGSVSILMGKSGVGKTSLMNQILPGQDLRVGAVSEKLKKGRHTTSFVKAYAMDNSSYVIDAPGMRELGLWDVSPEDLAEYFPEMRPFLGSCKFRLNCQHEEEPGCAIRQAVMNEKIDPYRYASYLRLKEEDDV